MKINNTLLLLLGIFGLFSFFIFVLNNNFTLVVTPKDIVNPGSQKVSYVGYINQSGLSKDDVSKLGLKFGKYEITGTSSNSQNKKFAGFYIEADEKSINGYEGRCVKVIGSYPEKYKDFSNESGSVNGLSTYRYLVLSDVSVSPVDASQCANVYQTEACTTNDMKLTGTVQRISRPAPDINYDYSISLDKPIFDSNNASGMTQKVSSYVLVPSDYKAQESLESNMGKRVSISGCTKWGYAESKYVQVTSLAELSR